MYKRQVGQILNEEQYLRFQAGQEVDASLSFEGRARLRVHAFHHARGAALALRCLPHAVPTLERVAAPAQLADLALLPRGLVLVCGATGSGKSTTLAALVDHYNTHRAGHILTLEDPIEFVHTSRKSLVSQREIGRHAPSFCRALEAALREDPDLIMVGELRGLETIRLALTAAETGHLVLGTLHTASAAQAVDRLVDAFPGAEQPAVRAMLSEALQAVVAQALLPEQDGAGRVPVHEIMRATPAVRNLIREGKTAQLYSAIQSGQAQGMQTLDQSLAAQVARGRVSAEVARTLARYPDAIAG